MKTPQELSNEIERLKDKAYCIILECDKWKDKPECVFKFGYAREKADGIIAILDRNEDEIAEQRDDSKISSMIESSNREVRK